MLFWRICCSDLFVSRAIRSIVIASTEQSFRTAKRNCFLDVLRPKLVTSSKISSGSLFSKLPLLFSKQPPLFSKLPPLFSKLPPLFSKLPPLFSKLPPLFSKLPPLFSKLPPLFSKLPPLFFYLSFDSRHHLSDPPKL